MTQTGKFVAIKGGFRPADWPFIWKFLVPAMAAVALIAVLAVTAALALNAQTRLMDGVVNGAMQNALFMGDVRGELRGDARDLYNTLAARAGGDMTKGSAANAMKISENLKLLQDKVKARAAITTDTEDKKSLQAVVKEIDTQKGAIEFVSSMLEIDLNAAISFLGPYGDSERSTDAIVQKVIDRTNKKAKALAAQSEKEARFQILIVGSLSVLAALTAGGSGLLIGRSTAKSIQDIAETTQKLAEGDMRVTPESLARGDELGKVVDALTVFKNMTEQGVALKVAQDASDSDRLRRSKEMEQLIMGFNGEFATLIRGVEKASSHLEQSASILTSTANENTSRAHSAVTSIFSVRDSMSTVAAASEELGATISEVDRQAATSAEVARNASQHAELTQKAVEKLSQAVGGINDIVNLIATIASQTNLLALNATIEAARAGDAGKGFAVVATEVKTLASATSKATEEIRNRIAEVQAAASQTTTEITAIDEVITQMLGISNNTSESVRQQVLATHEITQSLSKALQGAGEATSTMEDLNRAAEQSGEVSSAVNEASHSLSGQAEHMKLVVETFLGRAAAI
ncbi:methyl-accepting chemotaxis protein [Asticcacaulis benevestitus]|uniref:Methyl-accepting chemotaxis protein n=1 Tax=Asticcacaulis benevestitus DSM 16100 = ATCC BAA-896 TaxID=1121022 RepID=V4NZB0_9CAUL|nr:methyl-accepting chemotaxis protein [Asticcacaulis benevestitus]ESQ80299.1 hypothetical protein ABENE_22350 [Asticcacaulis benevestitus DSM 16100 = ATCC BAA-896]